MIVFIRFPDHVFIFKIFLFMMDLGIDRIGKGDCVFSGVDASAVYMPVDQIFERHIQFSEQSGLDLGRFAACCFYLMYSNHMFIVSLDVFMEQPQALLTLIQNV